MIQIYNIENTNFGLDIDPKRIEMGWVMDFCAQGLRNIIIGIGGRLDGFMMESKFGIAVGSELMAILAVAGPSRHGGNLGGRFLFGCGQWSDGDGGFGNRH